MRNFLFLMIGLVLMGCLETTPSARNVAEKEQQAAAQRAVVSVPIPQFSYFQEKRTIAKWAERWDKPAIATYVYLVSLGNIIGYYVADGKPASTRSYLMPEESAQLVHLPYVDGINSGSTSSSYYEEKLSNPDIDGTYGDNNPGIRFFTAEGTAVEWGGQGATYIYSDAPLPLNVPKLNIKREK